MPWKFNIAMEHGHLQMIDKVDILDMVIFQRKLYALFSKTMCHPETYFLGESAEFPPHTL